MDKDLAKLRQEAQELLQTSKRLLDETRLFIERSQKIQQVIKQKEESYPVDRNCPARDLATQP